MTTTSHPAPAGTSSPWQHRRPADPVSGHVFTFPVVREIPSQAATGLDASTW